MILRAALAGAALAASAAGVAAAQASETAFYGNLGYSRFSADSADIDAVTVRAGADITRHFGVEAEASFGVGDDQGVDLDNAYGIFARGRLPLATDFAAFARIGWAAAEVSGNGQSADDDGVAGGVGVEWTGLKGWNVSHGVRVEYTRYEFDDGDADVFGVSYVVRGQ